MKLREHLGNKCKASAQLIKCKASLSNVAQVSNSPQHVQAYLVFAPSSKLEIPCQSPANRTSSSTIMKYE